MENPEVILSDLLASDAWIRMLARHLVADRNDAEDAVQDAWVAALQNPPRRPGAARSWFVKVIRRTAWTRRRSDDRRKRREQAAAKPERLLSVAELREREKTRYQVAMAVFSLEEPYRSTVICRYFENMPPREISARLDVSVSAVHERLRRGLRKLRARLDRDFGDRDTWCTALLPLTVPAGIASGAASASVLAGALAMSMKVKIGIAVIAALAVAFLFWPRDRAGPPEISKREVDRSGVPVAVKKPRQIQDHVPRPPGARHGSAGPSARSDPGWFVKGRVETGEGAPVEGAAVSIVRWDWRLPGLRLLRKGCSREEGSFRLGPFSDRTSKLVVVECEGYAIATREAVPGGFLRIVLRGGGLVRGRVAVETGEPCAGVTVVAKRVVAHDSLHTTEVRRIGATAKTGDDGSFHLGVLLPGLYDLTLVSRDRPPANGDPVRVVVRPDSEVFAKLFVPPGTEVRGTVLEDGTRRPVSGALVEVAGRRCQFDLTGRAGRFVLPCVGQDQRRLKVSMAGYCDQLVALTGAAPPLRILLKRSHRIRGRVLGPSGAAVEGARIAPNRLSLMEGGRGGILRTTDRSGGFEINVPGWIRWTRASRFNIHVDAPGFARRFFAVRYGQPEPVELRLERGVVVSGRILSGDGAGVPGASVEALALANGYCDRVVTGEGGAFQFQGVPVREISLVVEKPGVHAFGGSEFLRAERKLAVAEEGVRDVAITLQKGAGIRGTVQDDAGSPVGGATVVAVPAGVLRGQSRTGMTTGFGAYLIPGVEPLREYRLTAIAPGYVSDDEHVSARGGDAGVAVRVVRSGRLRGRVVDNRTGSPLTRFTVTVVHQKRPQKKETRYVEDGNGEFTADCVPGDSRVLIRSAMGGARAEGAIHVSPGEALTRTFVVVQTGRISGTVVAGSGRVPGAAAVFMYRLDKGRVRTRSIRVRSGGGFSIENVDPGLYLLRARDRTAPHLDCIQPVRLGEGESKVVRLWLENSGRLRTHVVDAAGEPVAGAGVTVFRHVEGGDFPVRRNVVRGAVQAPGSFDTSGTGGQIRTNTAGWTLWRQLPPGRYVIQAICPGSKAVARSTIELRGGARQEGRIRISPPK